jgi:carbon monoxide dehydrogenase subunit G
MLRDPMVFAMSVEIVRPPEAVWPYLVDWERLDRWMIEARDFRVIGGKREGVGVVAEATVRIVGITTRDRIRVTRWEPPRVLEIAHLGWVRGTGYIEISPIRAGTRLWWREELRPPWGWFGRAGMGLFAPLMRRAFRRDLRLLKGLVESET